MSATATGPAAPAAAPRSNNGQFSPKAGATGVVPQGETDATEASVTGATNGTDAPPRGPQSPEEWSFEGEYETPDGKKKVAWKSKAEATRAAQELDWLRRRNHAVSQREKQFAEFDRLSPDEKARVLGVDVSGQARSQLLEAAKMADMSDAQREYHRRAADLDRREAAIKAEEDRRADEAKARATQARRQRAVAGLEKGLEMTGLPKTHAVMSLLAEIQYEATSQGLPELPPDLLAAEANKRYAERGIEPLKKLSGKALLDRLGQDVVRAVLMAERERRGLLAGQPRAAPPGPPADERLPPSSSDKVYGEAEAEAALRALRNR